MKIRVTSIQRGCVYDGPGVRTTVFLKGCTMSCPWCCNPETISSAEEYFIDDTKCLQLKGISSKLCEFCIRNSGTRSLSECPFGVAVPVSKDYTPEELFEILARDFSIMRNSGGGVTFSGGEPLLQIDVLEPLLLKLIDNGIHIVIETTLFIPLLNILKASMYVNLFIVDLKLQPLHKLYKNEAYIATLDNTIKKLGYNKTLFRVVFINEMSDDLEYTLDVIKKLKIIMKL